MLPFPHRDAPDAIPSRQGAHPFRTHGNLRAPQALSGHSYANEVPSSSPFLANPPLPATPHAQKTATSEKIGSNHPGFDINENSLDYIHLVQID
jgi:hypothetical protein